MSGHTSTASTQPFTGSAEVRRRIAGGNPPNQPSYDASAQPFTDSAEARRRAGVAAPEPAPQPLQPTADEPLPPAPMPHHHIHDTSPSEPPLPPPTSRPLDFPIEGLAEVFANASLATLPDARLVLASPAGISRDGSDPVIIPLPGGYRRLGIRLASSSGPATLILLSTSHSGSRAKPRLFSGHANNSNATCTVIPPATIAS
ncbi:uncharacterized protein B0T15DRAFT_82885 [Chaetomium strumarium]|uniref:Uncharacterized protein n=1 Tax=Chaetomium strumarium TaxID=1170767 RepID=A0AAJ0M7E6_9PEZI|nr:hypothetical protein B0T15DRAFT_82885 [Chaetomium strumarium]